MMSRRLLVSVSLLFAGLAQAFTPPPPDIAGRAWLLIDVQSGQTLTAKDENTRIEPASLTKLMTAYVTFKAIKEGKLKLDTQLTVSEKGWKTEGSRMFLDPKVPATVDDLIKGMIVQSGNDACVTLAEAIAGSEEVFAQVMNKEAKRLGMTGSNFENSTGLPGANHYMTVRDLEIIAQAIIKDFPEFYPIYAIKEFKYNNISQPNRNLLLYRDPNVDGMKTGHTEAAGYNLVASTHRDGRRLVSVVVGTAGPEIRATESGKLLNWGTQFFDTPKLYSAKQAISKAQVWKGAENEVAVGFLEDRYITVPKGDASKIKLELVTQEPLIAPLKAGQQVGTVKVSLDGKPLTELKAVALNDVPEAGFFGRAWDAIKLWFKSLFS